MPRLRPAAGTDSDGTITLPQPLAPSDAALARRIFALQADDAMDQAGAETALLADPTLLGAILADRYLRQGRTAGDTALAGWLGEFGDQPDAPAIRALLLRDLPPGHAGPDDAAADAPPLADPATLRNPAQEVGALQQAVRDRARAGGSDAALRQIARTRGLDPLQAAQLRAAVAQVLLTQNRDTDALTLAESAYRASGRRLGFAGYIAGLAAWRSDRPWRARSLFEAAAQAPCTPPGLRAAAAFWAARAHMRTRDSAGTVPWMRLAAEAPTSFYGLLARHALGLAPDPDPTDGIVGILSQADIDAVDATAAGHRAFALLQIGQTDRAAAELQGLWATARSQPAMARALLLVTRAAGLNDLAARMEAALAPQDAPPPDDPPVPRLAPRSGFLVDPALVYALTRVESNFDPNARSAAGARGLMQIMPVTVAALARGEAEAASWNRRLHDPALNLQLGQRYVLYLAGQDVVHGSLIHLLVSYNAGPGNAAKWAADIGTDDPLMFIEALPNDETRAFVQHALAFTWIYAARLHAPAPSLDELAAGAWPRFHPESARSEVVVRLH